MNHNPLESILVGSVMTQEVIEVEVNQSMCCAASALAKHGYSAAPVVDEQGRCVGILTGADFIKRECQHGEASECNLTAQEHELVKRGDNEPFQIETIHEDRVRYHMTPTVQSVSAEASLMQAATIMRQGHLHHLVVLDAHDRPTGMLSTIDVIATMLATATGGGENG